MVERGVGRLYQLSHAGQRLQRTATRIGWLAAEVPLASHDAHTEADGALGNNCGGGGQTVQ